jgi:hypothetical protein
VTFDNFATTYSSTLKSATPETIAAISLWVDQLGPGSSTNFVAGFDEGILSFSLPPFSLIWRIHIGIAGCSVEWPCALIYTQAAFEKAFDVLDASQGGQGGQNARSSGCTKAILFMSDGTPNKWDNSPGINSDDDFYAMLQTRSAALGPEAQNVRIFTYALGSSADPSYTTQIALRNGGLSQLVRATRPPTHAACPKTVINKRVRSVRETPSQSFIAVFPQGCMDQLAYYG